MKGKSSFLTSTPKKERALENFAKRQRLYVKEKA
jgi:hypothetical protein